MQPSFNETTKTLLGVRWSGPLVVLGTIDDDYSSGEQYAVAVDAI